MIDAAGKYDEMGSKSAGHGGGGEREGGGVDANIAMLEKEHEEITKVHTGDVLLHMSQGRSGRNEIGDSESERWNRHEIWWYGTSMRFLALRQPSRTIFEEGMLRVVCYL